jgi:PAS domain S-box-containing protein
VLDALPANMALLDPTGLIVAVNAGWRRFVSDSPWQGAELRVGMNYLQACEGGGGGGEVGRGLSAGVRRVLAGEEAEYAWEYSCQAGVVERWFRVVVTPVPLGGGVGGLVLHVDVTWRRVEREALRMGEERFRLLSKATNDVIWDWDLQTNRLWWNDGLEVQFGFAPSEVEPSIESWTRRIHPEDRGPVLDDLHRAIDGGAQSWSGEYRFGRRDGTYAFVLDRGYIIRDEGGRATRMIGGMTDLSERKRVEEKLQEQAALLDAAHEAIYVMNMEGGILYWNRGAERIYGWTAAEACGRAAVELLRKDPLPFEDSLRSLIEHGEWHGEVVKRAKNGRQLTVEVRWTLIRDGRGRPKSILAINTDVTERKRIEAHFLRAQRMESIGTLAGGVAHDLNNVLGPILLSIELLRQKAADVESEELLDTLQTSAERGASLVRQVLAFARGVEGERVPVDLAQLIPEILRVAKETFPKNIEVEFAAPKDLWRVTGDRTQLHQVFLNLCVNARDALPHGGRIVVGMENTVLDETYVSMNPEARCGPFVMVKVADTGTGIPLDVRDRVFEPFFTTKEVGKGTGLGLSTALAIVKSHGGFINLYSEMGKGTWFKVYLPARASGPDVKEVAVAQTRLPRGRGECVLVVDDEEAIRRVAQNTLERFGYRVLLAANGAEAVSIYARNGDLIAVVLTDMAMPIMDGLALIMALKSLNPDVRIIASSGLASNGGVAKALGAGVKHFVPKPYTAEKMLAVLREVLDGGAA